MERKKLANDLTDFCIQYKIFNTLYGAKEIKKSIEEQFDDCVFVERLINKIMIRAKDHKDIDTGKLIELLSELDKLRLELEFKAHERAGSKC